MNFDTNKLARALEASGLKSPTADAIVEAIKDSQAKLVTQDELEMAQTKLEKAISEALHRQTVYIIGLIIAAIGATAAIVHLVK